MEKMDVAVEQVTEEAQLAMACACGSCHPTATVYRDDPEYARHETPLAEGPCCCGRFFVVASDPAKAEARADAISKRLREQGSATEGHRFARQHVELPWGGSVAVVSADLP